VNCRLGHQPFTYTYGRRHGSNDAGKQNYDNIMVNRIFVKKNGETPNDNQWNDELEGSLALLTYSMFC
jgi:hypothetical protein